jgi:hypothetical protein
MKNIMVAIDFINNEKLLQEYTSALKKKGVKCRSNYCRTSGT